MEIINLFARGRLLAGYLFAGIFFLFSYPIHSPYYLIITAMGVGLRIWASGCIEKGRELSTGGPYSMVRHPLYLGTFLIGLGVVLTAQWWWWIGYIFSFIVFYGSKIKKEEEELQKIFGEEYRRYRNTVPAFFPQKLHFRAGQFSLKKVMKNKEYKVWMGLVSFIILYYYFKK